MEYKNMKKGKPELSIGKGTPEKLEEDLRKLPSPKINKKYKI